ncbi:AAA family ATPase [Robinsoniella peoriensis]|uniref:AAA family ATPase n=1 Tax=Robinsoniella peoriensis TaxID=180332 RepID=UPI00363E169B
MAIMIPSDISPDIKSNAEKHIYSWFNEAPDTEDWIVFHSFGIVNHNKVIHGEVDFFVLVPELGVFALEVKGGRVQRKSGMWSFTDKYDHTDCRIKGPFDQAWDGIYSIRKSIRERLDNGHKQLKNLLFGIGVMFPDVEYESVGIDEEQWQVFDSNDGKNVKAFILRIAKGAEKAWSVQYGCIKKENRPTKEDVKYLANLLRGDFDRKVSLKIMHNYVEEELITLTENQYRCIDQLEDNPRCLIKGAAGTGKTLIAVEQVKKFVAFGEKVALFCYNNKLGQWLRHYFSIQPENLRPYYVGTIHGYMVKIIRDSGKQVNFPVEKYDEDYFYKYYLPCLAVDIHRDLQIRFDRIIVDEAQDLITKEYLYFFESCLKRGIQRGSWTFFGDFSRQAIYTDVESVQLFEILEAKTSFVQFKLLTNCRNTQYICSEIETITGFLDKIIYRGEVCGPPVEYIPYVTFEEEKNKLIEILKRLNDDHLELGRITILSPRKRENSVVNSLEGIHVSDYQIPLVEALTFSTIQGFKGMENTVIILTDIESYEDIRLMYVAFSRAKSGLYVLESENAAKEYVELYFRRS